MHVVRVWGVCGDAFFLFGWMIPSFPCWRWLALCSCCCYVVMICYGWYVTSSISRLHFVNVYTYTLIIISIAIWTFKHFELQKIEGVKKKESIRMAIAILCSIFVLDLSLILKLIPWSTTMFCLHTANVVGHSCNYHYRPNERAHSPPFKDFYLPALNTLPKYYQWSIHFGR